MILLDVVEERALVGDNLEGRLAGLRLLEGLGRISGLHDCDNILINNGGANQRPLDRRLSRKDRRDWQRSIATPKRINQLEGEPNPLPLGHEERLNCECPWQPTKQEGLHCVAGEHPRTRREGGRDLLHHPGRQDLRREAGANPRSPLQRLLHAQPKSRTAGLPKLADDAAQNPFRSQSGRSQRAINCP